MESAVGSPWARLTEQVTPEPAIALAGFLDVDLPVARAGDPLPPLWHLAYLLPRPAQASLGPDGHPLDGIPAPPGPGRRRMFGGARVIHRHPLIIGEPAMRESVVVGEQHKDGGSGRMSIVTVRTVISQGGREVIREEQDIIYRDESPSSAPAKPVDASTPVAPPSDAALLFDIDPVVLFRFSALTYNAHRIHYDLAYAATEGYPDLVVHGPLQALLMAESLRRRGADFRDHEFAFRLRAPALGAQRLQVEAVEGDGSWTSSVVSGTGATTATSTLRPV